jgi:hypothetical protein
MLLPRFGRVNLELGLSGITMGIGQGYRNLPEKSQNLKPRRSQGTTVKGAKQRRKEPEDESTRIE